MWYILKTPAISLSIRDELSKANIQYYLPTYTKLQNVGGTQKRVERPLVFNFIFVTGPLDVIRDFCRTRADLRIHVVYNHKPLHETKAATPLIVSDHQMEMFQKAVLFYNGQEVPIVKPDEIGLEKGDHVRIIGGQFNGLEGVLISQKGKDGGRVVVNLNNVVAVSTLEIEPEYLQILKFGKDNKHFYKHLECYIPRLDKAIEIKAVKTLTSKETNPIETFVKRYSELQTDTVNATAKVLTLLYASYIVIGENDKANDLKTKMEALIPNIKSASTLEFVKKYL